MTSPNTVPLTYNSYVTQIENQITPPIVTPALPWAVRRAEVNTS